MRSCTTALILSAAGILTAVGGARAQTAPADFWQRGRVRELFISGMPAAAADLDAWAASGVNCVTGVEPSLAHAHGLKTRRWFTMNLMDSRSMPEETIKTMAAIHEDGSFQRPTDPLFPTVGQYCWTACINNPNWIEHARGIFRKKAQAGDDGCHIDYASHYAPCFCAHCQAKWHEWAPAHGLGSTDLKAAARAADLRTRMRLREFRIQCVIAFLGDLRATAQAIRPDFATDGTWHQDAGSTYQWAYGEHFDLMCIEGTTWGDFPPASNQVLWLKLAHALSARPAVADAAPRRPIAMSVTYHLLADANGSQHHGRMAPDRVRVALAEIIGEGAVSWLGLGGPKTGNLLKEHQDIVEAYFSVARDVEPWLVGAADVAEIGIVFSPRSYLLAGAQRTQLYAFGQALMRAHVPFRILSDVGLGLTQVQGLSGVVVLSAPALSTAACRALDEYVRAGGEALILGGDTATLTEDWRERTPRPEFAVPAAATGKIVGKSLGTGHCRHWLEALTADKAFGAAQYVPLDQTRPVKFAIEGWSKAEGVSGSQGPDYALYVDLTFQDGTPLWGQTAQFSTGTHDWEFRRHIIATDRPFKGANVHLLFRRHGGTAWFKSVRFGVWDEAKQQIVTDLLSPTFRTGDGKVYTAAAGEDAPKGAWGPYRDGFQVENMMEMGLWVKMSAARGLDVTPMNRPDDGSDAIVLSALAPLRSPQPLLQLAGTGADRVFAGLTRSGRHLAVHLINYAAELHPDLPELEQQKADRSVPATDLVLHVRLPDASVRAETLATHFPEAKPQVTCTAADGGVTVKIDRLAQYGVLTFEIK